MAGRIRRTYVEAPDSAWIAVGLNARGARLCVHERGACYLRCGVRRIARWEVIPTARRREWLFNVLANIARARLRRATE
jgi:hypothetical protein